MSRNTRVGACESKVAFVFFMSKKSTKEEFIAKARKVHGDKYDYSRVVYTTAKTKVCIVCPKHGEFWQTPNSHLRGRGCNMCGIVTVHNQQRKSNDTFISSAIKIHGNKYDYSQVNYKSSRDKVCIICPTHGIFWQTPDAHLRKHGCPECCFNSRKKLVYGVGINDCQKQSSNDKAYKIWSDMLARCYNDDVKRKNPTYKDCTCCNEWIYYSNFKKWFNAQLYKDGYHLDKDIIIQGNKIYSPDTCALVPSRINGLLVCKTKRVGDLMRGVSKEKGSMSFRASCCIGKQKIHLGSFKTELEAHEAYKKAKYAEIRSVAKEAFDVLEIDERVYNALLNYTISKY